MAVDAETGKPTPKPGVTVRIRSRDRGTWYTWQATLDGIPDKCFWLYANEDQDGNRWRSPEAAEADCREKLTALLNRLMDRPPGILAIAAKELTNITLSEAPR